MLYAFVDNFQFLLFDFPHLSSFNACKKLDRLIILYPPVPRTHEYWEEHCPPNYYGGATPGDGPSGPLVNTPNRPLRQSLITR